MVINVDTVLHARLLHELHEWSLEVASYLLPALNMALCVVCTITFVEFNCVGGTVFRLESARLDTFLIL